MNSTYNTDLLFLFTTPIVPPPSYNMTLRLKNLYVPISFTIINSTNNTFTLNGTDYTIPDGNYTAKQLATKLMNLVAGDEPAFTVSFSSITDKYTFSSSDDFTIDGTCDYVLGLDGETSSSSHELTSTYPVDLTGQNVIYLDVKNLSTSNLASSTGTTTSTVASVLVDVPYGSVLYYTNTSNSYFVIQQDHISFIHLALYGEDGQTLNGFDWSCTLEIGFVPKQSQPSVVNTFKDVYLDYVRSLGKKNEILKTT
jgi:hypothetical protein